MSDPINITTPSRSPEEREAAPLCTPDLALMRSEVYLFLARAFMYPQEPLDDLYQRAHTVLATLGGPTLDLLCALGLPSLEQLERSFLATFTHTTPPEFPPYEADYGEGYIFRQPQALVELAALYRAFALRPANGERLDHIGTELEFMYFLCYKEAFARRGGNRAGAQRCQEGQKHFLEHHLGRWSPLFLARLSRQPDGFYARLSPLTSNWLAQEAERLNVHPSPQREEDLLAAHRLGKSLDLLDKPACEEP